MPKSDAKYGRGDGERGGMLRAWKDSPTFRITPHASFDFTVLEETEDWLVVNKPAPLQIHPSKPSDAGLTLWDGLRELLRYELANGGQVSIVNRLDRETSGVVLVAKNAESARLFGKAMMRRQMRKTYLAIAHGWPGWERLRVDAPILRQGEVRESRVWVRQCVDERGAPCATEFRVLRRFERGGPFALVEASPLTGRMHQIRVHLAHAGHPVVGDKIYGADETRYLEFIETGWTDSLAAKLLLPRQALHSQALEVDTPEVKLRWEAPLTEDLARFLDVK
jgi:23S rRNA pseudouridine1911/1915/1917 synthase